MRGDECFKETPGRSLRFNGVERLLEGQRSNRIALVEPGRERLEHHGQAARKTPGVLLAQAKFDGVEAGGDGLRVKTILCQLGEGSENERFDFRRVFALHTLQAGREGRLSQLLLIAADDFLAQAGIDQRFAERGGRGSDQDVLEDR